jgi:hypothetical protein
MSCGQSEYNLRIRCRRWGSDSLASGISGVRGTSNLGFCGRVDAADDIRFHPVDLRTLPQHATGNARTRSHPRSSFIVILGRNHTKTHTAVMSIHVF